MNVNVCSERNCNGLVFVSIEDFKIKEKLFFFDLDGYHSIRHSVDRKQSFAI